MLKPRTLMQASTNSLTLTPFPVPTLNSAGGFERWSFTWERIKRIRELDICPISSAAEAGDGNDYNMARI